MFQSSFPSASVFMSNTSSESAPGDNAYPTMTNPPSLVSWTSMPHSSSFGFPYLLSQTVFPLASVLTSQKSLEPGTWSAH